VIIPAWQKRQFGNDGFDPQAGQRDVDVVRGEFGGHGFGQFADAEVVGAAQ
jgi:hypothetical protein